MSDIAFFLPGDDWFFLFASAAVLSMLATLVVVGAGCVRWVASRHMRRPTRTLEVLLPGWWIGAPLFSLNASLALACTTDAIRQGPGMPGYVGAGWLLVNFAAGVAIWRWRSRVGHSVSSRALDKPEPNGGES
jgi:hypothetical protein